MVKASTPKSSSESGGRAGLAVAGLLILLAGPVSYMLLLDQPMLRRSGLSVWLLMGTGIVVSVIAARGDRRIGIRIVAGVTIVLALVSVGLFFGWAALPTAETTSGLDTAPEFTLDDHTGRSVSLRDTRAAGAVLLVFYRGHW